MKRSAKDGEWSSLHYGGEGVRVPPHRTKVCARHGGEEACGTQGDLAPSEQEVWPRSCDTRR